MLIRTRISIASAILLVAVLSFTIFFLVYGMSLSHELERDRVADHMLKMTTDLILLTDEYLITGYDRAIRQWRETYIEITDFISTSTIISDNHKYLSELAELERTFTRLTEEFPHLERQKKSDLFEVLYSQVIYSSKRILAMILETSFDSEDTIRLNTQYLVFYVMILSSCIFIGIIVAIVWINKGILHPIKELIDELNQMAVDTYHTHINKSNKEMRKDEIGKLYKHFYEMSDRLGEAFNEIQRDLESRIKAENEIKLFRNYLRKIINVIPSAIIALDNELKVNLWNTAAEKMTGVPVLQAWESELERVFPRLFALVNKHIDRKNFNEAVFLNEKHYKNEQAVYESIRIYPFTNDQEQGLVILIDDVTEQNKLDEMMVQSEKMMSVGGLAAGMAHEINNPLAGIIQTSNVLKNRLTSVSSNRNLQAAEKNGIDLKALALYMEDRDINRMLNTILKSGERVSNIITNMLGFARKEQGSWALCYVSDVIDDSIDLAGTDFDIKKKYDFRVVKIIRKYNPVAQIKCQKAKLQQVFMNLFRNGAQAMQEAGTKDPAFTISINAEGTDAVRIDVADNGPGIPSRVLNRIFEPFFTTKEEGVGTGLGLSVSYFIICDNHNGQMTVDSPPGSGAVFTIILPIEPENSIL